jgi:xanthine dehydrogenase accessory factor
MIDLAALSAALAAQDRVARVVIARVEGSSPREVGASMLVWATGQSGTIGGGALEHEAAARARAWLSAAPPTPSLPHARGERRNGKSAATNGWRTMPLPSSLAKGSEGVARVERISLGPSLGQCCGGAVTLWTDVHDAVPEQIDGVVARGQGAMPLAVKRILAAARGQGLRPATTLIQGWLVEPVAVPTRQLWIWGAGHVGRALVSVLAPLPEIAVSWVDVSADRFPDAVPANVTVLTATDPALLATHAPSGAEHLILTFSHALDLDLCHRLLLRDFRFCGLIGSATKWARFRARLMALGHPAEAVARIQCPIGDPTLGKHPQAIAVGVASELLRQSSLMQKEKRA